jgi:hypothetical protein
MALPKWFIFYCDLLGVSPSYRTKKFDIMRKKAGNVGERFARETWSYRGYKVIRQNQRIGGYDYLFVKKSPYYSPGLPEKVYAEIKVNTSQQTKHQKQIEEEIVRKGGDYWAIRYNIPLIIAEDMA